MRLTRRRPDPAATYAAVVADRWLWVAAPGPLDVALEGVDLPATTEEQPGHHGVRLDLHALPAVAARYRVLAGRHALTGPPVASSGGATTHALERDDDGRLHVVRRVLADGPTLRSVRLVGDSVELHLDGATGPLELVLDETAVASVDPVADSWTLSPGALEGAAPGQVLQVRTGGRPVLRRANTLADPGAGALLPAVHPEGAAEPAGRLRWAPDGRLILRVPTR